MAVKQMKPFMTNVFLNAENEISDFLVFVANIAKINNF
jgi:hypothetical protein